MINWLIAFGKAILLILAITFVVTVLVLMELYLNVWVLLAIVIICFTLVFKNDL